MRGSARRMNSAVTAPRIRQMRKKRLDATRKAAWSAESANSARTRFGTWKAIVNADMAAVTPKYFAATTSRASPSRRERPVAKLKNAVLRARRRAWPGRPGASVATGLRPLHFSSAAPKFQVRLRCVYGQHRLTRKADPSGGARATREPPPHFPGEDLVPAARERSRLRRLGARRRGVPRARLAHRQGREVGLPAPQQRRAEEVARGARSPPAVLGAQAAARASATGKAAS